MERRKAMKYEESLNVVLAEESLRLIQVSAYPYSDNESRKKVHRKLVSQANKLVKTPVVTPEELANILGAL